MTQEASQRPLSRLLAGDWVDVSARRWPDRPCLVEATGRTLTFADVADRAGRLGAAMRAQGLRRGDRVAVLATDSAQHVEVFLACLRAGLVVCDLNFRLSRPELENILSVARPAALVCAERYRSLVAELTSSGTHVGPVWLMDSAASDVDRLITQTRTPLGREETARDEELVSIAFTSGTTGVPKGVMQSERMLRHLVYQGVSEVRVTPGGFRYSGAPLFHVSGILSVLYSLVGGCASLLLPQFDARDVLGWMQHGGLTHCTLIPTMINSLLDLPDAAATDYPALRSILYGGAPMSPALLRRTYETFRCDLYQGFGAGTETGLQAMLYPEDHLRALAGEEHLLSSVGRPVPGVDVRLCDENLDDVPRGEIGEVVSRSETVMSGYLGQPSLTARAVVDGWFRAGDMAEMDDEGFLYLATRKSDMIIRGGENIYPVEIESTLAAHPAVLEVSVVGRPDPHWGEVVVAAVVPRDAGEASDAELREYCRERLAGYKVPSAFHRFSALPKNATGKVVKAAVGTMIAMRETDARGEY
jgi:acyl-CoA synthetase (AMP-forming)/AMP-acid ligase II